MQKIYLLLSILFFIQVDCLAQSFLPDESNIMSYEEILNLYPKSLTSHLPAKIDGMNLEFLHLSSPLAGRFLSYIHLVSPYDTKSEKLKNEVALKAKAIYYLRDSCLTIPYDYEDMKVNESDSVRNPRNTSMLPIPNFRYWDDAFTLPFYQEAVVYLLDAEKGCFLPADCLTISGVGLPKGWEHGYTKGVAFYKNSVVYWLEVW